jgi:hypothetical protein
VKSAVPIPSGMGTVLLAGATGPRRARCWPAEPARFDWHHHHHHHHHLHSACHDKPRTRAWRGHRSRRARSSPIASRTGPRFANSESESGILAVRQLAVRECASTRRSDHPLSTRQRGSSTRWDRRCGSDDSRRPGAVDADSPPTHSSGSGWGRAVQDGCPCKALVWAGRSDPKTVHTASATCR